MSAKSTRYRFRPRFLGVAFLSLSIGTVLVVSSVTITPDRMSAIFSFFAGLAGLFLAFAYLKSPVWRLAVDIQDDDLVVWNGLEERMRLPWSKVIKVVMGPDGETCFVDGGTKELSLLVPGPGAVASYEIRHKKQLIAAILAHVDKDLIESSEEQCLPVPPQ
ncbi:MAG: hypothetical protein JKY56_03680 [Kofleriaceae bacterium]|nr:hypothetical protein [Kofleriaceae bacterium]